MTIALIILAALFVGWAVVGKLFEGSVETLGYRVLGKKQGYEIREYDRYIVASTVVSGTYENVTSEGFRIIAGYIFGGNVKKESVAMTAPVLDVSEKISMTSPVLDQSEKVAMTTPVIDQKGGDEREHKISFVMPKKYTLATLPSPKNSKVTLEQMPARKVAALRYSWYATDARNRGMERRLLASLKRDGVTVTGTPEVARYNAPFTAPFLNRNEILVPIQ